MPLARIITRLGEDSRSLELEEDLRARGFEVQTRSPEEVSSEPADLEIRLEVCAPEEALRSATNGPDEQDVCVFIAPGAMAEKPQPSREIPLTPEAVADATPVLEEIHPETMAELSAVASAPEPVRPQEPPSEAIAISDLEMQHETIENVSAMASELEPELEAELEAKLEAMVPQEPEPIVAAASHLEIQPETVEQPPALAAQPESLVPEAMVPEAMVPEAMVPEAMVPEATVPETMVPPQPEPISDWPIWQPVAEPVRAEQPTAAYQTEVPAEAVLHPMAQADPLQLILLAQSAVLGRTVVHGYKIPRKRVSREVFRQVTRQVSRQVSRNDKLFWGTATLAAMFAVAVLLLGASAHRLSPLPSGLEPGSGEIRRPVSLQMTKRGAKLPGAAETLATASKAASKAVPAVNTVAGAKPSATRMKQSRVAAHNMTLTSATERVVTRPLRRSSYNSEADIVAEDTVVRYDTRRATAPVITPAQPSATASAPAQKKAQIKHYSDLN